jgi:hypothetical protein
LGVRLHYRSHSHAVRCQLSQRTGQNLSEKQSQQGFQQTNGGRSFSFARENPRQIRLDYTVLIRWLKYDNHRLPCQLIDPKRKAKRKLKIELKGFEDSARVHAVARGFIQPSLNSSQKTSTLFMQILVIEKPKRCDKFHENQINFPSFPAENPKFFSVNNCNPLKSNES